MIKKKYQEFLKNFFTLNPFGLNEKEKSNEFLKGINILNKYHYKNSKKYREIINKLKPQNNKIENLAFLPVTIFKEIELHSIKKKEIDTIAVSSGTTGNNLSKIYLNKENSINQYRVLNKILSEFLGNKKFDFFFLSEPPIKDNNEINAKSAGIFGFSSIAKSKTYGIKNNSIQKEKLDRFLKIKEKKILFGFTSDIWKFLIESDFKYKFNNTILIHGGGWKKLENKKISSVKFDKILKNKFKFSKIINYYGMIEQTGSIFLECHKCKNFITSIYSDIIIRDENFNSIFNKPGLIQLISLLPISYPGHNILTQDIGIINNKTCNDCSSKKGKRFKVLGRVINSDVRGCSNI